MIVAERPPPRRTVLPTTPGSLPSAVVQKRCVNTATGAAFGTIIRGVDEAAAQGPQTHHVEERAADHSRAHDTRLAETDDREAGGREVAQLGHGFQSRAQIDELGHRERHVLDGDTRRALADVNQPRFVPVDERPQEHAADDAEHRRVGADAQREGHDDGQRQPLGASERPERKFQVGDEAHKGSCPRLLVAVELWEVGTRPTNP